MGLLDILFGGQKSYADAGFALIIKLTASFNLPGWKDGLPDYTPAEIEAIARNIDSFQEMANKEAGGKVKFHPEIIPKLHGMLAADALIELAEMKFDEICAAAGSITAILDGRHNISNFKERLSTLLKAWASNLNPKAMLEVGRILVDAGHVSEAKDAFRVILMFPSYSGKYYAGNQTPEMLDKIVKEARESLDILSR